ncbi:hypothetical protein CXB51_023049 [Gossypium anomalum]|uniref:Uncharacterized protein n=1 Tax=Gossypium anomalum TaxID=47600 RepID=A0A8J5Z901_9ROSI|nr:hypothetical protein CXB51_023049 [Gossypium anomalum]
MAEASSSAKTTVTNAKIEVEKFYGTNNFGMWQYKILDALCQQELDIALEEKPNKMDDKEWAKINRQTCGTIRLCLAKEQKYSVMWETSVKKLWNTLEEKFLTKSLEDRLYMKKKLYRFTYAHGMSMNDHVNSFNKILVGLLNLDEKFEDEDKALLLLNSLPDEYDHLTTTLLHGKDTIIFDVVCSALYRSETRKKDKRDHRDITAEVLTVRGRLHGNKSGKMSKSKGRPAKDELEHDEESDFSLVSIAMACHTDKWILDLGCTYRMCPNKDWFSSLKKLEGRVIFMGNDNACKTMGVGTIQLKNHDGSIQVLTDVRYVPRLKKNLISLGVLESKVLTITLRDGLLKVVVGVLTVIKGTIRNNLYYLNGSTVIGSTSTASVKDADSEATRLGKEFWAEAVTYACHLINRLPSAAINGKTPIEMWTGKPATDYDSLHVFGSTAYYHVKESKLNPRAKKALFVGITDGVKGYCLWCPDTMKIIFSKDVTFDESTMMKNKDSQKDDKTSSTLQQVELEKVNDDPANIEGTNDEEVSTQELLQQQ